jgi:hypothetical protein
VSGETPNAQRGAVDFPLGMMVASWFAGLCGTASTVLAVDTVSGVPVSDQMVAVVGLVSGVVGLLTALGALRLQVKRERAGAGLSSFAAALAGRHRGMRHVWLADLAGDPENGLVLTPWQRRRMAMGFIVAALRLRAHDLLGFLWAPVDWVLAADQRRNAAITTLVGAQAVYIVQDGGLPALVTEVWEPCGISGAALYVLSRWLRRLRGIELATRNETE